jgi:hypothetical protein
LLRVKVTLAMTKYCYQDRLLKQKRRYPGVAPRVTPFVKS